MTRGPAATRLGRRSEYNLIMLDQVLNTLDGNRPAAVDHLKTFLRFASVSTDPERTGDVKQCAQWLCDELSRSGLAAQVMPTGGHPVIVARNTHVPGRPTILLYGHYDVQPAEPLELWQTPPFEPTVRGSAIYARGAADDKGQIWAHVEALRAWHHHGGAPVNVTLLFEGEEEIGSANLAAFIAANRELLHADLAMISDTGQFAPGVPAITYGLRGLAYMEVTITGPDHDLHSGLYGGAVPNPANVLAEVLASLHDSQGRVNIPGFYDDVAPLTKQERALWAKLPFDEPAFKRELALDRLTGEEGFSTIERKWGRPTCDINGLTSGYQGPGAKTIIPSKASAKVSMRLVPNQEPARIETVFTEAVRRRCPAGVKVEVVSHHGAEPVVVPLDSRGVKLAAEAIEIGFGRPAVFIREGGSIPVVSLIRRQLGIDSLLVGFGLPDDRVHSPNEKFDLDAFHNGARTAAALYAKLAAL